MLALEPGLGILDREAGLRLVSLRREDERGGLGMPVGMEGCEGSIARSPFRLPKVQQTTALAALLQFFSSATGQMQSDHRYSMQAPGTPKGLGKELVGDSGKWDLVVMFVVMLAVLSIGDRFGYEGVVAGWR